MNAQEYQKQAFRTLIDDPEILTSLQTMIVWCAIGLSGESGEVADHVKKGIFHHHGLDKEKLKYELGDCLWYIASMCSLMNFNLDEIMQLNIDKIWERYPNGYSPEDSQNRKS